MNYEQILYKKYAVVDADTAAARVTHSKNVVAIAKELNQLHHLHIKEEWIEQAGYLHDYAKYNTKKEFIQIAEAFSEKEILLATPQPVWHALFGPHFIERDIGKLDSEVMEAIRYHTTGKKDMSPLQELIMLADFIEEGRDYQIAKEIRKTAYLDYKKAIAMVLKNKIAEVTKKKQMVHSNTKEAFQDYEVHLLPVKEKLKKLLQLTDHNLITDIKIFDTTKYSPFFDAVVITTALSSRQMEAAVSYITDECEVKGLEKGDFWILIDLYDVIFHLFLEEARKEYGLDRLYGDLPLIHFD